MVDNNIEVARNVAVPDLDINPTEARVNLTWGQNYDLRDPVLYDISDADLKGMVAEIIRAGGDEIPADQDVGPLSNFVVDRHGPTEARPWNLIVLRAKTSFGR